MTYKISNTPRGIEIQCVDDASNNLIKKVICSNYKKAHKSLMAMYHVGDKIINYTANIDL